MKERSFDEMIAYFNRKVSEMDIAQDYKMELFGMVAALGFKHKKSAQQWIPCSVRLPEKGKDVLVTRYYDGREDCNKSCRYVEIASCYGEDDDPDWASFSDEYKMHPKNHHVIAWRELPEPWKGEQE